MGKLRETVTFASAGIVTGIAGVAGGACSGGCSACFRCAGLGVLLIAAVIVRKRKGAPTHGLAEIGN